jgi:activator of HSP90 ATPase
MDIQILAWQYLYGHTNPGTAVFTWTYKSWHGSIYMDIQILARQYLHGHTNPGMAVFTWTYKSWHGSIYMDIQILARQYSQVTSNRLFDPYLQ